MLRLGMFMKYKIEISEGCTSFYTSVNDKLWSGEYDVLSEDEKTEFVDFLCEEFKKQLKDDCVSINDFIRCFQVDESQDGGGCEQCGDHIWRDFWYFEG